MSLVGILTQKSHETYLKPKLYNLVAQDQIFFLKEDTLSNLRNIKFQTILIGKKVLKNKEQLRQIAKNANHLIFNADISENLDLLENLSVKLITYGFNSKATITTSSVEEGKVMVCLQRVLENNQGKKIEPQEFCSEVSEEENGYEVMELVGLQLLLNS